jgi:hypothetical protein
VKYSEAQFHLFMARAARWTALVNSGAYKLSKKQRGRGHNDDGTIKFRDLTDEEKLEDAMATIDRHIQIASDFAEHFDVEEQP